MGWLSVIAVIAVGVALVVRSSRRQGRPGDTYDPSLLYHAHDDGGGPSSGGGSEGGASGGSSDSGGDGGGDGGGD